MVGATVFNSDPTAQARAFEAEGFKQLHVVDLDAVVAGRPINSGSVEAILRSVSIPLQLGGGIRDMATVEFWLAKGVNRLLLGTAAVRDPRFVGLAARRFPSQIAVAVDARQGQVSVQGRSIPVKTSVLDAVRPFEDSGVAAVVYTDLSREGMLGGLDIETAVALADAVSIPIMVAGGFGSITDVQALLEPRARKVYGAIVGRAIYEGKLDGKAALSMIAEAR
jgi:phosphoribosylformimino-5-aminoimidazole carboxamide ribotide isomerase